MTLCEQVLWVEALDERIEFLELSLLVSALLQDEGIGSLRENAFVDVEGGAFADGKGDGIGGARIQLDEAAALTQVELREEGLASDVVDQHVVNARIEVRERIEEEVVGQRTRRLHLLERDAELHRLLRADPDGNDALLACDGRLVWLENQDGWLLGLRENHCQNSHLNHGVIIAKGISRFLL